MAQTQPIFSIIIPTFGRPEQLGICLQSLANLDYPRERFEVIVVDDGGKTSLEHLVAGFQDRIPVRLLTQTNAGPAAARNRGAEEARGVFLAFTDDDCQPASNWLTSLAARFSEAPDQMIGGRTLNLIHDNPYTSASQLLIDYLYSYYERHSGPIRFFTSNNLAVSAERFFALEGFDTTFPHPAAEDREFCDRWLHHGYEMTYAPDVVVYHAHALTFRTFCCQHFNYGRGAFRFHQLHARRGFKPIKIEPLPFYFNLLCYPFSSPEKQKRFLHAALLLLSQIANACGFFWERGIFLRKKGQVPLRDSLLVRGDPRK
jgi:glycosyltransferase involved in cell wall biosynthesis